MELKIKAISVPYGIIGDEMHFFMKLSSQNICTSILRVRFAAEHTGHCLSSVPSHGEVTCANEEEEEEEEAKEAFG
jgi:hypothetical protein